MLVWILQTGEPLNCDKKELRSMRAINLADALLLRGHNVEIISTRFFHQKKLFRKQTFKNFPKKNLTETLIFSTGYKKNKSLNRFIDHHVLFFTLFQYLVKHKDKPDLIFIGCPPLEWALAASIYSYFKKIKIITDIKDLWPDIFWDYPSGSNFKKFILKIIFTPYRIYASLIVTLSDYVTGPTIALANFFSKQYQNKLLSNIFNKRLPSTFASPIVPPPENSKIKINFREKIDPKTCLNIFFLGSLMSVYDFKTVYKSLKLLDKNNFRYKLFIAGKGGNEEEIKKLFKNSRNVEFLGWINREKAIKVANSSHLAIAPYQNMINYELNLVNKYIDYMSLGLPVLSPLKGYIFSFIEENNIGINYKPNDPINLSESIIKTAHSQENILSMSQNAYELFLKEFKYEKVYGKIVDKIENL